MFTAPYYLFLICLLCFSLSACRPDIGAVSMATPSPRSQPSPTASQPGPATSTPVKSLTRLTAAEFLAYLPEQPADAILLHLDSGLLTQLDAAGKSASWTADFWWPAARQRYTFTLVNGIILTQARPASPPEALLTPESINLELTSFLQTAAAAGGKAYLDKGYGMIAGLRPDRQTPSRPIWTIIYLEPGHPNAVFTHSMDALK